MRTEYSIPANRYNELKFFCRQYPDWEKEYATLDGWAKEIARNPGDKTSKDGIQRADLKKNMALVQNVCTEICGEYSLQVFLLVTRGIKPQLNWDQKDFHYYYRKFFWELSKRRG